MPKRFRFLDYMRNMTPEQEAAFQESTRRQFAEIAEEEKEAKKEEARLRSISKEEQEEFYVSNRPRDVGWIDKQMHATCEGTPFAFCGPLRLRADNARKYAAARSRAQQQPRFFDQHVLQAASEEFNVLQLTQSFKWWGHLLDKPMRCKSVAGSHRTGCSCCSNVPNRGELFWSEATPYNYQPTDKFCESCMVAILRDAVDLDAVVKDDEDGVFLELQRHQQHEQLRRAYAYAGAPCAVEEALPPLSAAAQRRVELQEKADGGVSYLAFRQSSFGRMFAEVEPVLKKMFAPSTSVGAAAATAAAAAAESTPAAAASAAATSSVGAGDSDAPAAAQQLGAAAVKLEHEPYPCMVAMKLEVKQGSSGPAQATSVAGLESEVKQESSGLAQATGAAGLESEVKQESNDPMQVTGVVAVKREVKQEED